MFVVYDFVQQFACVCVLMRVCMSMTSEQVYTSGVSGGGRNRAREGERVLERMSKLERQREG